MGKHEQFDVKIRYDDVLIFDKTVNKKEWKKVIEEMNLKFG